jgi:hypothetical protein
MTASFGISLNEHLEDIITGSNVMGLVAIQPEFVDLSEYESPNCRRLLHHTKHIEKGRPLSLL